MKPKVSSITRFTGAAVLVATMSAAPAFASSVVFGGLEKCATVTGHAIGTAGRATAHAVARPFHGKRAKR